MANSVPKAVAADIRSKIFAILEERNYFTQGRKQNGELMEELVSSHEIGDVLAQYMPRSSVKTYIKDAVINSYSKTAYSKLFSIDNIEKKLSDRVGAKVNCIEGKYTDKVLFLRSETGVLIVAGIGTITKWETALRKALEYIEKAPNLPPEDDELKIYLLVSSLGKSITQSELEHISRSLSLVNVHIEVFK